MQINKKQPQNLTVKLLEEFKEKNNFDIVWYGFFPIETKNN